MYNKKVLCKGVTYVITKLHGKMIWNNNRSQYMEVLGMTASNVIINLDSMLIWNNTRRQYMMVLRES